MKPLKTSGFASWMRNAMPGDVRIYYIGHWTADRDRIKTTNDAAYAVFAAEVLEANKGSKR